MARRRTWIALLLVGMIALAGCGTGGDSQEPVIRVATQIPPDADFITYRDPNGVFSLRMPPDWIAGELPDANGVRVQFTDVDGGQAVTRLSVYVVNTGAPMTPEAFAEAVNTYQPPADLAQYEWTEVERADMPDGSRRITGVRTYPLLGPRSMNIYLEGDGSLFSALEVDLTGANDDLLTTLSAVINTFRVDPQAELAVGAVQQAASVTSYSGVIRFNGYLAWTDPSGVFHITGEAINTTQQPLEAVRLSGVLYDAQGRRLVEQSDILSVDVLGAGEGAPFDLRFEGGKPPAAVRYELNVAGRDAEFTLADFYGPGNFTVANDEAIYNDRGNLVIRGELANTGPSLATAVRVVVGIWDDQGHVVAAQTVFVTDQELVPQEATGFEVTFYDLGGPALNYTLSVVGTVGEGE